MGKVLYTSKGLHFKIDNCSRCIRFIAISWHYIYAILERQNIFLMREKTHEVTIFAIRLGFFCHYLYRYGCKSARR